MVVSWLGQFSVDHVAEHRERLLVSPVSRARGDIDQFGNLVEGQVAPNSRDDNLAFQRRQSLDHAGQRAAFERPARVGNEPRLALFARAAVVRCPAAFGAAMFIARQRTAL